MRPASTTRRWGATTSWLARDLMSGEISPDDRDLAARYNVSRARISQIRHLLIKDLGNMGEHWREDLMWRYLKHHRPEVASESLWYALDRLDSQVHRVVDRARAVDVGVTVSADLASDLTAPWASPSLTVVYASAPIELGDIEFVPAQARGEATVLLRVTHDLSLTVPWHQPEGVISDLPLAEPLQQMWDLHDLGGEEREEGALRLVKVLEDWDNSSS